MKYKVGDRVRVRNDLVENESYSIDGNNSNINTVVKAMLEFKSKEVIIERITNLGQYYIKGNAWGWTDEMLEELTDSNNSNRKEYLVEIIDGDEFDGNGQNSSGSKCTGLLSYQDKQWYFLSNDDNWDGTLASDLKGYKYSWILNESDILSLEDIAFKIINRNLNSTINVEKGNTVMIDVTKLSNKDKLEFAKLGTTEQRAYKAGLYDLYSKEYMNETYKMVFDTLTPDKRIEIISTILDTIESVK